MNTKKIPTQHCDLSVVHRKGYYYAVKTIKGVKRQLYLGKTIPCQDKLDEVALEITLPANEWVKRHNTELRRKKMDESNVVVSQPIEQLILIEGLAKARGEHDIAKQLNQVIRSLINPA